MNEIPNDNPIGAVGVSSGRKSTCGGHNVPESNRLDSKTP